MDELQKTFCQLFGETGKTFRVFAPYRVCPLGAHVDHQHGLVSGFAINSGIDFLLAPTDTGRIEMASLSFSGLPPIGRSVWTTGKATGETICGGLSMPFRQISP